MEGFPALKESHSGEEGSKERNGGAGGAKHLVAMGPGRKTEQGPGIGGGSRVMRWPGKAL